MKKKSLIIGIIFIIIIVVGIFVVVKLNSKNENGFTKKELNDMEYVDHKLENITKSDNYKDLSIDGRKKKIENILNELKKDKYINYYIYDENSYMFSFEYKCGVLGGVMLKEFDPMLN